MLALLASQPALVLQPHLARPALQRSLRGIGPARLLPLCAAASGADSGEQVMETAMEPLPGASPSRRSGGQVVTPSDQCPPEDVTVTELLRFTLPVLSALLSSEIMSVVDTAVVGTLGPSELAALGPATMLSDSTVYLFFWLNVACTNLFASNFAAGEPAEAFTVLSDALWISLACGALMAVGLATCGPAALAAICREAPAALPAARRYLSIRLLGVPALMTATVLQGACTGSKDATSPFIAILGGGALNLLLDVWLVLGLGLGVAGAAAATVVSQVVQLGVLAVIVQRKRAKLAPQLRAPTLLQRPPPPARLRDFLGFAGPIFLVLLGKIACYNSMTLAATTSGVVALAAHQVVTSVFFLGCKFGDAVSQTAQAYLPSCLGGALEPGTPPPPAAVALSRKLAQLSAALGAVVGLGAAACVLGGHAVFTTDGQVVAGMASIAPLLWLALTIHPNTMCFEGLLLGGRQVSYLATAYLANILIFLSSLFAIARGALGLGYVWSALAAFQIVRLLQFAVRVRGVGLLAMTPRHEATEPA